MSNTEGWVGRTAERRVLITADLIDRFVSLTADNSRIHVDDEAARARGFRARVAHGMLLGSLVSAVVGTELPGHAGVLQEMKLSFRSPCYVGDQLHIKLEAAEYFESVHTLMLKVTIKNQEGVIVATGSVQSGVTDGHE